MKTWLIVFGVWVLGCLLTYWWLHPKEVSHEAPFKAVNVEDVNQSIEPNAGKLIEGELKKELPKDTEVEVEVINEIEIDSEKAHHESEPYEQVD
jgi:hypothetical protein